MEQRYIMLIKEFDPEIAHIAGSNNTVADALNRPPQITAMHVRAHQEDPDYLCSSESESSDSELDMDMSSSDVEFVSLKLWIGMQLQFSKVGIQASLTKNAS